MSVYQSTRYQQSRDATLLGALKNIVLSALKIIFGMLGHSHALFADGIHSLSDLLIDGLVLIASKFGNKAADEDHPYGHRRIETAATVLFSFILLITAASIIYDAGFEIYSVRSAGKPDFYLFFIVLLSILFNEGLYFYTKSISKKINSSLLMANALHHRTDSVSSIVVLLGLIGAFLGYGELDAWAAIVVALLILRMAWKLGMSNVRELVDTGVDEKEIKELTSVIQAVPGVKALH